MERYFILDDYNTWYDWDLILTAKSITPPEPNTKLIKIDGQSGSLDLSESLSGEITFNDRVISATFWTDVGNRKDRERLLREITAVLHGRKVKIIEPDDLDHYFFGRITIKSSINNLAYLEFTIEATCEPWRYSVEETIREINLGNYSSVDLVVNNHGVKTICPAVYLTASVTIAFNGYSQRYKGLEGVKISYLKLRRGVNVITLSGSGIVRLVYREADL